MTLLTKLGAYRRLGFANLVRVFWYLLRLKSGYLRRLLVSESPVAGPFFVSSDPENQQADASDSSPNSAINEIQLFGWYWLSLKDEPDWHQSVLTHQKIQGNRHWTEITDFGSGVGDIKGIWEASRFTWLIPFVQNHLIEPKASWLESANQWLQNWSQSNPANQGPNWKCAQETSLRVIHLSASALLIKQKTPSPALMLMLQQHLRRIEPTLGYARAQDNNHGTSEAAALFIGGSWLLVTKPEDKEALKWRDFGRTYLIERVNRLILEDGSFSQYSVNYHRLMLDTLSMVELWRKFLGLADFPQQYIDRLGKAANWLFLMTDEVSGDAANIGANDGAHILNFSGCDYRDFRPSVELAAQLFLNSSAYQDDGSKTVASMFDLTAKKTLSKAAASRLSDGGYGVLSSEQAWCVLRVPKFRFRPGQADCLHLDLWVDSLNLLRDAGSYSYNTEQKWLDYFSGVQGHNTIQFDGRESVPKVSRFLFGKWPQAKRFDVEQSPLSMSSSFSDWQGASHSREVILDGKQIIIVDKVEGFKSKACLRWRLADMNWRIEEYSLLGDKFTLDISSSKSLSRFALAEGFESRYYGQMRPIPVLEVEVTEDAEIKTVISW